MKTIPRKSAAREWAPFKRPGRRRQEFGPEPSGVGCSGPGAIGPDARGNLSGPLPEASKTCRRPILGLLADLGPRPGCAFGGRGGARIPKSLFLVWGCRSPAPRPCAQGASLLGRASRPRARVFAPHAVRPRPGSLARMPGPDPRPGSPALLVRGVWREPAYGEPARALPGGLHKSGCRRERGGASRHGGFIESTLVSQKTSRAAEGGRTRPETLGARLRSLPSVPL